MNNDQNRLHGKRLLDNYRRSLPTTGRHSKSWRGHRCHWTIGPIARNTPFPIDIALFVAVNYVISNEISRLKLCICKMAPIKITPGILAHRIVPLLPQDPVLNRVIRVMLSRQLEIQIEPELYFAACDLLLQNGKIGRLRGQSGQIFLAALNRSQPAAAEPAEPWPEARLMQPLRSYLEGAFRGGLDLPADGIGIVQILPRWAESVKL
jgi:hypothetical protein